MTADQLTNVVAMARVGLTSGNVRAKDAEMATLWIAIDCASAFAEALKKQEGAADAPTPE